MIKPRINMLLTGKDILEMSEDTVVYVNVNRLYLRLAMASHETNIDYDAIQIIKTVLNRVNDEGKMFIEMAVSEIKMRFGATLIDMPYNSFRKRRTT